MGGYFSDIALDSYRSLVSELQGANFAEGEVYDFTRCVRPDGTIYGSRGKCRQGVEIGAKEVSEATPKGKLMRVTAKIKAMPVEDLKRVLEDPRINSKQRKGIEKLIAAKNKSSRELEKRPEPKKEPKTKSISDEKLKRVFDRALSNYDRAKENYNQLTSQGLNWNDERVRKASGELRRAQGAIELLRQSYYAVNRGAYIKAVGDLSKVDAKADANLRKVQSEINGLNLNGVDSQDHPLHERRRVVEQERIDLSAPLIDRAKAAFYGEPQKIATPKSDGGGEVHSLIPSGLTRGGADKKLKDFLDGAEVVMAFEDKGFAKFIKEGEAKNGFHKGTAGLKQGRVKSYLERRRRVEENVLKIPQSTEADGRPVYAVLEHPDRARSLQGGPGGLMPQYGGIQVIFNPSVKDRSTFTLGDSIDYANPRGIEASPVRDPSNPRRNNGKGVEIDYRSPHSRGVLVNTPGIDFAKMPPDYVEAQIHGGLKTSQIKEVRYYKGHEIPPAARKLLEKQGVKITELPPQRADLLVGDDHPSFRDITAIQTFHE
jgi:hypothetical protein